MKYSFKKAKNCIFDENISGYFESSTVKWFGLGFVNRIMKNNIKNLFRGETRHRFFNFGRFLKIWCLIWPLKLFSSLKYIFLYTIPYSICFVILVSIPPPAFPSPQQILVLWKLILHILADILKLIYSKRLKFVFLTESWWYHRILPIRSEPTKILSRRPNYKNFRLHLRTKKTLKSLYLYEFNIY